ncbi:hypothetical protein D3C83_282760 [compost metagenome]
MHYRCVAVAFDYQETRSLGEGKLNIHSQLHPAWLDYVNRAEIKPPGFLAQRRTDEMIIGNVADGLEVV